MVLLFLIGVGGLVHFWSTRLPGHFILKIPVTGSIEERESESALLPVTGMRRRLSLEELLTILDRAVTDRRVDSILLQIDGLSAPTAKIQELSNAIGVFRKSGRKVTAFLHTPEDKDYQLAAACDTLIMEKGSWMMLDGLKAELFFYAEPLEKLGISFQAAQWKKYKSAVEPFTRKAASQENLEETRALLDDAWSAYLDAVSRRRGIKREAFGQIIDSLAVLSPEKALELHLVDRVLSVRQFEKEYAARAGDKPVSELFVDGAGYLDATGGMNPKGSGDRIAVLTITGMIVGDNQRDMDESNGTDVASVKEGLQVALDDPKVKAIVLRIDSPGGDALAASSILELLEEARKHKPMVASMSGVAASGGYMVALAADTIYAQPMTVTGSIGVFALKPDLGGLLQKTGIRREVLVRGRFADAYTPFKPFDEAAFLKFTGVTGEIYKDFTNKVAGKRHLTTKQIEAVAGGRVWSGQRALSVDLVDRIGGLSDAVQEACRLAGMEKEAKPELLYLPIHKTWIEHLLSGNIDALVSGMSDRIASRSIARLMPITRLPGTETARILLRTAETPQVLAIQPFELEIR
ncbi:MAG: signal peptide peptidase SppA [Chlorobiaceae bacterium]|nr:signal peptide peptidase SppA [Chlorobiaceae bacterium]